MKSQKLMLLTLSLALFLLAFCPNLFAQQANKRVLMVLSGYGQQQGEQLPGYEFDEFAKAYLVFKVNGLAVEIASPQGGAVEADAFDADKPFNVRVLNDADVMAKLSNTLPISTLNSRDYQGIFIVGGKGAMFDLVNDNSLQSMIADIYQQQGSVAAVCHGPAALVNVKLANGRYLVADRAVNSFTNTEEKMFGKKWLPHFDFLLEDKLIERGAKFQSSDIMLSHVAVDGRLITGQNPSSTVAVATELVKSLGLTPVEFAEFKDDKTLALVAQVVAGNEREKTAAKNTLKNQPSDYHIALVGMYGYYYLQTANTDAELENALTLMLLAQRAINNPKLDITIAKTQYKLGDSEGATATLEQLLSSKPDFQPAIDMLSQVK